MIPSVVRVKVFALFCLCVVDIDARLKSKTPSYPCPPTTSKTSASTPTTSIPSATSSTQTPAMAGHSRNSNT